MTFDIVAAKRICRAVQNERIDDLVSGNLRGQKCPAVRKFQVGKFHEPVPWNMPHPFIVHGLARTHVLGYSDFFSAEPAGTRADSSRMAVPTLPSELRCRLDQLFAIVVAEDERIECLRADGVAANHKLLALVDAHLQPGP